MYKTWRITSDNQAILFVENEDKVDKLVNSINKKLIEFRKESESVSDSDSCDRCIVKSSIFKVTLDQEYITNDVYEFRPEPLKQDPREPIVDKTWYSKYSKYLEYIQYWPFKKYKKMHMLFENESAYVKAIEFVCGEKSIWIEHREGPIEF